MYYCFPILRHLSVVHFVKQMQLVYWQRKEMRWERVDQCRWTIWFKSQPISLVTWVKEDCNTSFNLVHFLYNWAESNVFINPQIIPDLLVNLCAMLYLLGLCVLRLLSSFNISMLMSDYTFGTNLLPGWHGRHGGIMRWLTSMLTNAL